MIAAEERNGLSVGAAFDALRLYARDQNIKLTDLAVTVVHNNFNPQVSLGPRGTGRPVAPCEGAGRLCYTHRSFVARTAAWTRFRTSSLRRISWMCVFTVFSLR